MGFIDNIKNFWFTADPKLLSPKPSATNINRYIAPVQFFRIKQDIAAWRSSILEAERPILPFRVEMQRIFADTRLNAHVAACVNKRKNFILLKDFAVYDGDKIDEKATEILKQQCFYDIFSYVLDADYYGYSLIGIGGVNGNTLEKIELVKRENISPDRLSVAPVVYSPQGSVEFMNPDCRDDAGNSFFDWSIYIDTKNETGQSKCGYGLLYVVAYYEIFMRNLMGFNSDYAEVFGQPLKHVKTNSDYESTEYNNLEKGVSGMASNSYIITDTQTDIEFITPSANGKGYEVYPNLEQRCEKKISKYLLGHEDALASTPGKLGSNEAIEDALKEIETVDVRAFEHKMNSILIPKFQKLGIQIPLGRTFKFKNDKEKEEIREKQDASNKITAEIAKTLKDAGLQMDSQYFFERTGIKVTEVEEPAPTQSNNIKNSLKELYGDA